MEKSSLFFIILCCAFSSALCLGVGLLIGSQSQEFFSKLWTSSTNKPEDLVKTPPSPLNHPIKKVDPFIVPLPTVPPPSKTSFTLHFGSYTHPEGAQEFVKTLNARHIITFIEKTQGANAYPLYLVCSGSYSSHDQALAALQKMNLDKEIILAINIIEIKKNKE